MFNKNQIKAISHKEGPAIVLAGPGSGKTTVITHRVKNLIEDHCVPPEKILVVTFTKAAAVQMKKRFEELMKENNAEYKSYPVTFGTFHSIYYGILKTVYNYTEDNIVTDRLKSDYIKEIAIRCKFDVSSMSDFIQNAGSEISKIKGNLLDINEYYPSFCSKENFIKLFNEYENTLEIERKLDFDDMLIKCRSLLLERIDVLNKWQEKFQYILIDEFQDINSVQYEIIKLLAQPHNNIFIVGDDDQSIYGFRGACPEIMFKFKSDFSNANEILLDVNYRSIPRIVELSQNLIKHNKNRFNKKIISAKSGEIEPDIRKFRNQGEELRYMCDKIQEYIKNGISPEEIVILIRNNSQIEAIRRFLQNNSINVKTNGKRQSVYDSVVGKDVVAYIKAALSYDAMPICKNTDLIYIINKPQRFISRQIISQENINFSEIKKIYCHSPEVLKNIEELQFHLKMISRLNPMAAMVYIRNGTGYEKYLREYAGQKNIKMSELLSQLDEMQNKAQKFQSLEKWIEYIETSNNARCDGKQEHGINIMTMHSAKGLEFKAVFVIDVNQGVIPTSRAVREKDFEEERRVFYVALTRASENLNVYGVMESLGYPVELSMFIEEMMGEWIKQSKSV